MGSNPMAPAKISYLIVVHFVDDSYWDDGNRTTRRNFGFKDVEEFKEFYSNLMRTQKIKTKGRGGEKEFNVYLEDIYVYRLTEEPMMHKDVIKEFWNEADKTRGEES